MFVGLYISHMRQYIFKCLFIRTQLMQVLIDTDVGYHLGAPNLWSIPLIILPIQYSPLFPNCPARSHFKPFYQLFNSQPFSFTNQGIKALNLMSEIYHSTSTGVLSTKHSTTNGFFIMIGSKWYIKGGMHSRVLINSCNVNAQPTIT
jgi:hypothetical protein